MLRVDLSEITAALITGALGGLAVWVRDRRKAQLEHAVPAAAAAQVVQSRLLTRLAQDMGCVRALLLKAHNGGEVPHGGRDLKVTILSENQTAAGIPPIAQDYQARPVTDTEYRRLIAAVDEQEVLLVRTRDLTPGTMLRDEYERAGIKSAWVAVVKRTPERWFYLSCASQHLMDPSPAARACLRAAAAHLARLVVQDLRVSVQDTLPTDV